MKQKLKHFCWLTVVALVPYLLYGFRYFPVLDDYIQYWGYPARGDLGYVYTVIGTLATRPMASLLDPLFWGQLWPCLTVALILITILHVLSLMLLHRVLQRYRVTLSPLFELLYLLLPLGMEGRFWLSASTRLVVGLFFATLSLDFLSRFTEERKRFSSFALFALFQLIACGFYEAVAVFTAVAATLLAIISYVKKRDKVLFAVPVTSFLSVGLLFVYYKLCTGISSLSSRVSSDETISLFRNIGALFTQLGEVFALTYHRTVSSCIAGVKVLGEGGFWGFFVLLCILVVALLFSCKRHRQHKRSRTEILLFEICGLLLFFAPLLPNLMVTEVWITNRSLFLPLIGLCLMAEPLFNLLCKKPQKIVLFLLTFLCLTAAVNEYDVYRRVHLQDIKLLDAVISQMTPEAKEGTQNVTVVLSKEVTTPQSAFYKDHVKSVFDSDWALTGAIRARMKSLAPKLVQPVIKGTKFDVENMQIIYIEVE
ncbi:MAG: hypothetical protein II997_01835 [Clostridia bacterium]|nr:hypothetical protein [Clostridia bacterium]